VKLESGDWSRHAEGIRMLLQLNARL
jgi:hypothetical protein